ncbi:MAG: helix-turn-helix domain-containing protein [Candidatus Hadarchaeales archaeon]
MPRKKVTPELVKKMEELRKQGWTYQKIATKLGLSTMTVYNHLKQLQGAPKEEAPKEVPEEKKEERKGFFRRLFGR